MKQIIEVPRAGKSPSKVVAGNAITALEGFLPAGRRVIVITDANLHRRYRELIGRWEYLLVGFGEAHKTLATVENLYRELIDLGADRRTFLLGIGGGIVTDIAGFVASTFMRGVDFGFVATSLLAQVDASIGGKNGVNIDGYKNMAGTFNQPDFVLCDTGMLATLPERELRSGMAEVVKAAVIGDAGLFEMIESRPLDEALLRQAVPAAIRVKAAIVEQDEKEAGIRKLLNLGHTFAHAIEKRATGFTHGEAVAIGLRMICDLSVRMGELQSTDSERIIKVLQRLGLPTDPPLPARELLEAMAKDKKRRGSGIDLVVIRSIGNCEIRSVGFEELSGILG